MKIIGVVRTLNEDDIIEAVIRHHLAQMDQIIVLDDGSNDRTVEIVKNLIAEGLSIDLIERRCVIFDESNRNTFLFNYAREKYGATWVFFFDADEFLDMRNAGVTLRNFLEAIPGNIDGVQVRLVNYMDAAGDDVDEIAVPKRMVWRHKIPHDVHKIMMRAIPGVTIHAGNHNAQRDGNALKVVQNENIVLGHYPRRSGWHDIYKWIIGRLKISAAGTRETSAGTGSHYIAPFEIIMNRPEELINNAGFFNPTPNIEIMENNPIAYAGGDLMYTHRIDYKMKCISMVLKYSMELATEFGQLMDTNEAVRKRVAQSLRIDK